MRLHNWPLLLLALVSLSTLSCDNRKQGQESQQATTGKMPRITFDQKDTYDFGTMKEGDVVEHVFTFTNTGQFPLIINNVTASCGCTTPEWPKEPVAPGAKSSVRVRFNSLNKSGEQQKTVTIFANTDPSMTELHFKAMVDPKPAAKTS